MFGGNKLDLAIISDIHSGDKSKLQNLKNSSIIPSERVLTVDEYVEKREADIEDIMGKLYFEIVNRCYGLTGSKALREIDGSRRVVEEVATQIESYNRTESRFIDFDHLTPAIYLLEHSAEFRSHPEYKSTLHRFSLIFQKLNKFLP